MRRVIEGKAYNTEKAELIAETVSVGKLGNHELTLDSRLYRTGKGAWFYVSLWRDDGDRAEFPPLFRVIDINEAAKWCATTNCTIHNHSYLPTFEEA